MLQTCLLVLVTRREFLIRHKLTWHRNCVPAATDSIWTSSFKQQLYAWEEHVCQIELYIYIYIDTNFHNLGELMKETNAHSLCIRVMYFCTWLLPAHSWTHVWSHTCPNHPNKIETSGMATVRAERPPMYPHPSPNAFEEFSMRLELQSQQYFRATVRLYHNFHTECLVIEHIGHQKSEGTPWLKHKIYKDQDDKANRKPRLKIV